MEFMSENLTLIEAPKAKKRGKKGGATTRQSLAAIIKSARNTLRTDSGVNGDTDRLEQLSWMLFLKWLDDFQIEAEALHGAGVEPIVEAPYRWRDWAANSHDPNRLTGEELVKWVNNELFDYLQKLAGRDARDMKTLVGTVFQHVGNRIRSGYVLRSIVDMLGQLNFNAEDDIHTASLFYESMLLEARNVAGQSGEFYTPRPLVRFIVDRLDPQLGEIVLDPACGTGGFLVEAFEHIKPQARTPEQKRQLEDNLRGIEKKPQSHLLGVVNLLLHGIERPFVVETNALQTNIAAIRDAERVHVIGTNPPFGGTEEPGIVTNFPVGMRAQETAILFFQLLMARLNRQSGRAGLVLPNGFLFGTGVAARVKEELLRKWDLHTIVRLPEGVFEPYTSIPANLLFFRAAPSSSHQFCTREVWFYEQPLPEGRKKYTKTNALTFEEFEPCRQWWNQREETSQAWRVPIETLIENGFNLDIKNPNRKDELEHLPPAQLLDGLVQKEQQILRLLEEIRGSLGSVRA